MFIWTIGSLGANLRFIIYYSTSTYYFSSTQEIEGKAEVLEAFRLSYIKHFGSLAFGSALHFMLIFL